MLRLKIILQSKTFIILSLFFLISYVFLFAKIIKPHSIYDVKTKELTGIITDYKIDGDKLTITLKCKEKIIVFYYMKNQQEQEKWQENLQIGMKINIEGEIYAPSNNTIPSTFNYKKYLNSRKIYWCMNASKITIENDKISTKYKIKNWITRRINSFSKQEYLYAFILGKKDYIDSSIYEYYQENGVTHLFAISGMHISFLVYMLKILLQKLKIKETIVDGSIISFLVFYMFFIGTASVFRASLLYIGCFINKKSNFNLDNKIVLYLIFTLLLIINPLYIYDLGFLYSFLTSFGLMLFAKKIKGNYLKKLFQTSCIAFLFSAPITIYNFYEINILTILNNIIIVPLVSLILFPLSLFTFIIPLLESFLNIGIVVLENINQFLNLFKINIIIPKIGFLFLMIYYCIIFLIYKYNYKKAILIILLLIIQKIMPYFDGNTYIYYLDVGQGDSSVIISGNKKDIVMIDTGGILKYAKEDWQERNSSYNLADSLTTFLKSFGINKIDSLILTHGDYDHMGEAINLVNNFKVGKVIFNCGEFNELEQDLIKVLDKNKMPYYSCIKELNIDNNKLYFLNNKDYGNENDNSNVIYTKINDYKFLFMGDASSVTEKEILSKYNLTSVDVLKVGHHGSKTSSSEIFIDTINPKYSIISVGKNNRYGHPNKETLNNLGKSKIYRTDIYGSIMLKIKNNKLKIETCVP